MQQTQQSPLAPQSQGGSPSLWHSHPPQILTSLFCSKNLQSSNPKRPVSFLRMRKSRIKWVKHKNVPGNHNLPPQYKRSNSSERRVLVIKVLLIMLLGLPWWPSSKESICLPMQEMQVWSLGREDTLKKEMATHSSILAWEIPRTEELGGLQSMRSQKSWTQFSN